MISNFASVSVSWCDVVPLPVNRRHFFFALMQVLKSKFFENSNLNAWILKLKILKKRHVCFQDADEVCERVARRTQSQDDHPSQTL